LVLFQSTRPARDATLLRGRERVPYRFQSTRPARDATHGHNPQGDPVNVSIHASRAGRDLDDPMTWGESDVSIHASRAGRDYVALIAFRRCWLFQSTRPARDATGGFRSCRNRRRVSIHASRAGRDPERPSVPRQYRGFNPRVPRGTRQGKPFALIELRLFQSTRPARDATNSFLKTWSILMCFNPRVPRGTRPSNWWRRYPPDRFQSTRPARDATPVASRTPAVATFQSTRPARDATGPPGSARAGRRGFNPRVPRGTRPRAMRP